MIGDPSGEFGDHKEGIFNTGLDGDDEEQQKDARTMGRRGKKDVETRGNQRD